MQYILHSFWGQLPIFASMCLSIPQEISNCWWNYPIERFFQPIVTPCYNAFICSKNEENDYCPNNSFYDPFSHNKSSFLLFGGSHLRNFTFQRCNNTVTSIIILYFKYYFNSLLHCNCINFIKKIENFKSSLFLLWCQRSSYLQPLALLTIDIIINQFLLLI